MKENRQKAWNLHRAYRGDALIVALLCLICIVMALLLYMPFGTRQTPNTAVVCVTVAGNPVARYPLGVPFDGEIASTGVHLVIADGRAYVADSDCPDRVCVASGALDADSPPTKSIVCLPNQVVIFLEQELEPRGQKGVDIVVG